MTITAKFASTCPTCSQPIAVGSKVEWSKGEKARHTSCPTVSAPVATEVWTCEKIIITGRLAPVARRDRDILNDEAGEG